jgi:hypothetical protein
MASQTSFYGLDTPSPKPPINQSRVGRELSVTEKLRNLVSFSESRPHRRKSPDCALDHCRLVTQALTHGSAPHGEVKSGALAELSGSVVTYAISDLEFEFL